MLEHSSARRIVGGALHLPAPVNAASREIYPTMSPDGEFLFLLSTRLGTPCAFWVDASVVTDFLP